ncbi:hypothetical protein AVEN_196084-1 [Araneus ventricosus]|uniref:Uncharacterized protein n=1 Tax=Araneus ventricosus TaxID=182803 RepID=A0A4Y2NS88_ARAVE|nr:hypothetical protein AVEN_196084-1 [Araneus ventricosus]
MRVRTHNSKDGILFYMKEVKHYIYCSSDKRKLAVENSHAERFISIPAARGLEKKSCLQLRIAATEYSAPLCGPVLLCFLLRISGITVFGDNGVPARQIWATSRLFCDKTLKM